MERDWSELMAVRVAGLVGWSCQYASVASLLSIVVLALTMGACLRISDQAGASESHAIGVDTPSHLVVLFPHPVNVEATISYFGDRPGSLVYSWEQASGPGKAVFDSNDTASTNVKFTQPGLYALRFRASDGRDNALSDLQVQVVAPEAAYFVSPDGSNRNDGRSLDTPFRTISRAARAVRPGDTVLIRGGIYHEYNLPNVWLVDGEPGSPITFTSYPGEIAIIDGSEVVRDPNSENPSAPELIRLLDREWYVFDNLVFRNSAGRGLSLEGSNNVARHVTSYGNHGDGIHVRGDNNLVEHSLVFDNFSTSNGGDSADGLKVTSGTGNVIRYVVSHSNSDDGFDLWATDHTLIEYSIAYNNGRGSTGDGNGFKLSSGGTDAQSIVRFNVSHSNRLHNFTDNGGGGLLVYNNTSWSAGDFGFVFRGRAGRQVSELINNISYEDRHGVLLDVQITGGQAPISTTNSWDLGIVDPQFVTTQPTEPGFLMLARGSPAIGVGTDVGYKYTGVAMDLGAFEFSADY